MHGVRSEVNDPFYPDAASAPFGVIAPGLPAPAMIDFRGHDGHALALPYARLESVALGLTPRITLEYPEHRVVIHGRNLRSLYDALVAQRVTFVQEDDLDTLSESEPFVDRIVIAPVDSEVAPGP